MAVLSKHYPLPGKTPGKLKGDPLPADDKLRPAGAGYRFGQNNMNFIQQAAGLHAAGKQRSAMASQAGALYQGADFKIESIV